MAINTYNKSYMYLSTFAWFDSIGDILDFIDRRDNEWVSKFECWLELWTKPPWSGPPGDKLLKICLFNVFNWKNLVTYTLTLLMHQSVEY